MDDTIFIEDPDCIVDDIVAHNERHVIIYQPPKDISFSGELNPGDQDRLREYQYTKLQNAQNIRLLKYSAAADGNEIIFELNEDPLDNVSGGFIAMSYSWGSESPTERLPLSTGANLKVTRTVFSLLRHVAGLASGLPVWVDAICINQVDLKEKNTQVSMMKDIYAAAKCVFVWLGNGNITQAGELALWSYLISPYDRNDTASRGVRGLGGAGDTLCGRVLQSPWFERVWVVQEACFARKIFFLCGAVGMSLPFLKDYLEMRRENYKSVPNTYSLPSGWGRTGLPAFERFRKLCKARELIQQNGGQPCVTLTDILLDFQACKATNPRDKVFALVGLATYHRILTDYAASIGEIYTKAMIACAPSLYDYRILGYAGLANPRSHQGSGGTIFATVPTWVPDFSCHFFAAPFTVRRDFKATSPRDLTKVAQESMSGKPQLAMRELTDSGMTLDLFIQTTLIDTIEELSMPGLCSVDSPFSDDQEALKRQYDISRDGIMMLKRRDFYPISKPASVVCRETMTTGGLNYYGAMSEATKVAAFEAFQESKGTAGHLSQSRENGDINKLYAQMHLSGIGLSRRLFATQNGYLGAANNDIIKGDRVCLISGAPVPFILRGPMAKHGPFAVYNLVCDAYVHGAMYGEAPNISSPRFETALLE